MAAHATNPPFGGYSTWQITTEGSFFQASQVSLIDGCAGQVTYGDVIVWQGKSRKTAARALQDARSAINVAVLRLFDS